MAVIRHDVVNTIHITSIMLLCQHIWQRMSTPLSGITFTNEFLVISAAVGVLLVALLAAFSGNIGTMSETLGRINEIRIEILNEKLDVVSADRYGNTVNIVLTNYGHTDGTIIAIIDATGAESDCGDPLIVTPEVPLEIVCRNVPDPTLYVPDTMLVITSARNILEVDVQTGGTAPIDTIPTNRTMPINPIIPALSTLQVTPPNSTLFDNTGKTIDLYTYGNNKIRIDTYDPNIGTRYFINDKADITIFRDTEITNRQFIHTSQDPYCYVSDLLVGQEPSIPIQHTSTLQLAFRHANDPTRCDRAPVINLDDKLDLDKEIYVRFVDIDDIDDIVPFYYIDDNIVEIPKCTTNNFNSANNNLVGNTEICYGKSGSDIILVSKILAIFGV